ncbi:MAG: ABC transporter permease [Ignavibacteriota bacterium]|jgi:putative ABC transport system permease protein|nr:MAG: ABC transporter permease [Chlorobiota bacterium]MBE7477537.1 ABC transporter permease [Ignavibacteriales bacterium]MBL1123949.1 ABC transporter permease [Ignavibacteriota bacterium]MCC7093908.1 ABC transporter permease [Ignavibacteriaceae bacterium]MCE7857313.1 ABC transporter permease [Ignavibacteria bacterium CHB3]MEB2295292.1 FtsX-like permease family protein [Ignavibacteria bacterium]
MKILKLILKNPLRHKLRTVLTILGIAIAVIAFGLLRTVVTAWYVGVEGASANRLITRQAVSFIFPLPYSYRDKIAQVDGIEIVTFANWFGGVYIDKNQFFARIAADAQTIFDVYSEFLISKEELETFKKERNACVLGEAIAKQYNLKIGDVMTLEGDIYPGTWDFVVRGIYRPRDKTTDASQMIFHWDYVNERMKEEMPTRAGDVGWYIEKINDPSKSAMISEKIDALFKNSPAETITETERAFQQGFLSSTSAIITSMNIMSFVIIGIIMLVLGNTMIMSARERTREYAVFKALGFSGKHLTGLIMGESLFISALGGGLGLFLTFPIVAIFEQFIPKGMFPVFQIEPITIILAVTSAIVIGIAAAIFPIQRALTTKIIDGFRFVG